MTSVISRSGDGAVDFVVEQTPYGCGRICPMMVGINFGRCFRMSALVRPGHVAKNLASMAWQNVLAGGKPAVACKKIASSP